MTWKSTALSLLEPFGTLVFKRLGTPDIEINVQARLRGYRAEEIVGGVNQGDRQVTAYADDVTFTPPLKPGDKVMHPLRTGGSSTSRPWTTPPASLTRGSWSII